MGLAAVATIALGSAALWGRETQGPRVDAYVAVERPIQQTLLLTGRVAPPARVDLGAQVQSTVVEVFVEAGAEVEAGDLLVRLADDEAQARLLDAEAQVAEATARLQRVRGVGRKVASERVAQAQQRAELAESDFERVDFLHRSGNATEAAHDAARQARDTARSELVAAELEAAATAPSGSDTAAAAAGLSRAQAALDLARAGMARTQLRAPSAGQILRRDVEVGQVVRPGDVLVELAQAGALEVRVTPDEFHLGSLAVGQAADVEVEAFPERPLRARVAHIAPIVDPTRGTVEVRLALEDEVDGLGLRPDMSATVEVLLGSKARSLVLPGWLVRDLGAGAPWVMVARDGVAEARPITLGLLGDDAVEVVSGLGPDDAVLPPESDVAVGEPVRARPPRPALPER